VRFVRERLYGSGPDGLAGNDDGGTLSAWYVWSALGLYPIPGSDRVVLGIPSFPEAIVRTQGGTLRVTALGAPEDPYVQSVTLDGVPVETAELRQSDLEGDRELVFVLGPEPPQS
jgi:putative alpha-1,2-mannosidase